MFSRTSVYHLYMFIVVFLSIALTAQAGFARSVTGRVLDQQTGDPLAGANIVVEGYHIGSSTDLGGVFDIHNVPNSEVRVIVTMIGYGSESFMLDASPNASSDDHYEVNFTLSPSRFELPSVVVTATQTPRFIQDIPVRTEVLTCEMIEQRSASTVYDALEAVPGVRVEQQCQFCNFSVLRMQGLGANHTQVLLDGQPLYSGLASVYGLQQMGTANINRIEVVKGAGSALYGSNAIAGAINIVSQTPQSSGAMVNMEFGEYGARVYQATAQTRFDDIGLYVYAQRNEAGEIDQTGEGNNRDQVYESDGFADRIRTSANNFGFNIFFENFMRPGAQLVVRNQIMNEDRRGGEITDNIFENPFTLGTEGILTDRYSGIVSYSLPTGPGRQVSASAAYTHHERNATNDTFYGDYESVYGEAPPVDIMRPYLAEENLYIVNLSYTHALSSHRVMMGLQYSHNELDESGNYLVLDEEDPLYGTAYTSFAEKQADDYGVYIQDEFAFGPDIEFVAGVRYDYHESEDTFAGSNGVISDGIDPVTYDESSVNPRFALRYSVNDRIRLRASVGTGFRVPYGFSEDLHLCSGSPRVWKPADLKPEESVSFTLSADYSASNFTAGLSVYRTDLSHTINFMESDEQPGYDYKWTNYGNACVMGVEANTQYSPVSNLNLTLDVTCNLNEYDKVREDWIGTPYEDDSRQVSRYPSFETGFSILYSPRNWKISLNGDLTGTMFIDYYSDDEPTEIYETDPYLILNTKVTRSLNESIEWYVGVNNLTDYVQPVKHLDDAAFMFAPVYGRIAYTGFRLTL